MKKKKWLISDDLGLMSRHSKNISAKKCYLHRSICPTYRTKNCCKKLPHTCIATETYFIPKHREYSYLLSNKGVMPRRLQSSVVAKREHTRKKKTQGPKPGGMRKREARNPGVCEKQGLKPGGMREKQGPKPGDTRKTRPETRACAKSRA